jgi:enoyl-CoA hydratase/carnithine racemase
MQIPVDYRSDAGIVTITLNDPDKRNGLSPELIDHLVAAVVRLNNQPDVRCAILAAAGTAFSAGGDPRRMLASGLYPDMSTADLRRFYREGIQRVPLAFVELEVPVIAAVQGPAIGAGCDLACLCDLRVAAEEATFATSFVKLGLVPGDGGAWLLPRVIGFAHASEMLLSGETIDARKALSIGLVSAVVPRTELMVQVLERAKRIAANPPHAVRLTKRLISEARHLSLPAALELSATMQSICHKMDDHREAVTAFIEKRSPIFKGK